MQDQLDDSLPSQTQLYALYISLCLSLKVSKPNQHILDLLEEDNYNRRRQLAGVERGFVPRMGDGTMGKSDVEKIVPLAQLKSIPNPERLGALGTRGAIALIRLLSECPLIEIVDLSNVPDLFASDPYKEAPSGNVVVSELVTLMQRHNNVRRINIKGHPIGTLAAASLLNGLEVNGAIVDFEYDANGVAPSVARQIALQLDANRNGANSSRPASRDPSALSATIQKIAFVDRKSSEQRLALRTLLDITFGPHTFADDSVLATASLVTLGEAALRSSKEHLYLINQGTIDLSFGPPSRVRLVRGDYFGEPVNDILHSSGLMSVGERGTAFMIPLSTISSIAKVWADRVSERLPFIKKAPLLQPLSMWVMCRLCHMAETHTYTLGDVVLNTTEVFSRDRGVMERKDRFLGGLFMIVSGALEVSLAVSNETPLPPVLTLGAFDLFGHDVILGKGFHVPRLYKCASSTLLVFRFDDGIVNRHILPLIRESLLADLSTFPSQRK